MISEPVAAEHGNERRPAEYGGGRIHEWRVADGVLLVDAACAPVTVLDWRKAVCLLYLKRAEAVGEGGVDLPTPSGVFRLPPVIRLGRVVPRRAFHVPFSRKNVFLRDDYTCQYCGRRFPPSELSLDHVVPRSKGGRTCWENVVTCCRRHNQMKGGRMPREVGLKLLRLPAAPRWGRWNGILARRRSLPSPWLPFLPASLRRRFEEG